MEILDIVRYFGALALVLALVGGAGIAVKRFGLPGIAGGSNRRMRVVETLMLGPRHKLFLVRLDGQEHLIALGPQGVTSMGASTAPADSTPAQVAAIHSDHAA